MNGSSPEGGSAVSQARLTGPAVGAAVFGCVFALIPAVNLVRGLRLSLLLDAEPSWAVARLLLGLVVVSGTVMAGVLGAALFVLWSRTWLSVAQLLPLPLSKTVLGVLSATALVAGTLARLAGLGSIPEALWVDDSTELAQALDLSGTWRDFADPIRLVPYGGAPAGTVGVLYLEFFRLLLLVLGPSTFSLRLPAVLAGIASIVATALLARRVLPRGGATLTMIVFAGLYWNLVMSRIGWNAVVVAPIATFATLLLLHARERQTPILSLCAGALVGVGAHVYIAAWVAAGALLAMTVWPGSPAAKRTRWILPGGFLLGLVLVTLPLFVLGSGKSAPYLLRTGQQNVFKEIRYWRSLMPIFEAAADGVRAPWITPSDRWPGSVGLSFAFRALLAVTFLRGIRRPRDELSMIVLAHGGAALAATVLGGHRGVPNGFRYAYLSDPTAVAIAGGALWTLLLVRRAVRPALTTAVIGLLLAGSLLATRNFFRDFDGPPGRDTSGEATMVGRAALRWDRYGKVDIDSALVHFPEMVAAIRRYRLDAEDTASPPGSPLALKPAREFRIVRPGAALRPGERAVEHVRARGWTAAVVLGRKRP